MRLCLWKFVYGAYLLAAGVIAMVILAQLEA